MNVIRDIIFVIIGITLIRLTSPFILFLWKARPRRPRDDNNYRYIKIEDDGKAREVTLAEKEYLETKFLPGDGARPYIKGYYEETNGLESLEGFLLRRQLPGNIPVLETPSKEKFS